MTKEEHRLRHIQLHQALDELCADWIEHNSSGHLSTSSIMDLIKWSHRQTVEPEDLCKTSPSTTPTGERVV